MIGRDFGHQSKATNAALTVALAAQNILGHRFVSLSIAVDQRSGKRAQLQQVL